MPIAPDTFVKIALAPLLLGQALDLRRRALRLPEPPGPRSGTSGEGPALRLLILGDSSAAGVGASTQAEALSGQLVAALAATHRVSWQLTAKTGATTASTLARLSDTLPSSYDVAVVALGVNDLTSGVPLRRWLAQQRALRVVLRERYGIGTILLSGLPPMGDFPALPRPLRGLMGMTAARFSKAIQADVAQEAGTRYLPFEMSLTPDYMAEDGFHPGPKAYALWGHTLADRLREELARGTPGGTLSPSEPQPETADVHHDSPS